MAEPRFKMDASAGPPIGADHQDCSNSIYDEDNHGNDDYRSNDSVSEHFVSPCVFPCMIVSTPIANTRATPRSLHNAAKILIGKLEVDQNARTDWDVCPVVLLYRQAPEIHLKSMVGEGSNSLKTELIRSRFLTPCSGWRKSSARSSGGRVGERFYLRRCVVSCRVQCIGKRSRILMIPLPEQFGPPELKLRCHGTWHGNGDITLA